MKNHTRLPIPVRRTLALAAIGLVWAGAATAQTVSGDVAIRVPAELPLLNGHPDVYTVPVMAGGNVGGVRGLNNLGATAVQLSSSLFGQNIEHLRPNAYLGQALAPPSPTSGATVVWSAMTNTTLVTPSGAAFFEASVKTMYAARGGEVVIRWKLSDGSEMETTYVVESAPEGRPYRVYWTDRDAPKVSLAGKFVKFHYNSQITEPQWRVFTNNNNIVESNVVAGLYVDTSGNLNAIGGQRGMIVMQYFKNGMYEAQVDTGSVIVIEVMPPDNQTLEAAIGERILPQGGSKAADELTPEITKGLMEAEPFLYQHTSPDGSMVPKKDWLFPIRRSVESPWNIEIYWKVPDLMGTRWFYEVDNYAAEWPACVGYVRGDDSDLGAPLVFPSELTPQLQTYQEPEDGCAVMQDLNTLITTRNEGRCLVQLLSEDSNVWFLPIELTTRYDPDFDLRPIDWMIGREIQPISTARSILFPPDAQGQATLAPDLALGTNFTVECWVMTDNLESHTNASMTVFDKNTAAGHPWSSQIQLNILTGAGSGSPGAINITMGSGVTNSPTLVTLTSTGLVTSFQWAHLAVTYKHPTLSVYVNGILGGQKNIGTTGSVQTNASPLYLGMAAGTNRTPLVGFIDNIRAWKVALTAEQVQTAMEGNHHGHTIAELTSRGLEAYFPIDANDVKSDLTDLTGKHAGSVNDDCFLPDVGAMGKSDLAGYSEAHGYIYEPAGTAYNTDLYNYPALTGDVSAIYGVNTNTDLEVWWSRGIVMEDMPATIYVPNWVQVFRNTWPEPGESPLIVLASGEGSRQGGIYNQGFCLAFTNSGPSAGVVVHPSEHFGGSFTVGAWVMLNRRPDGEAMIVSVSNDDAPVKDNVSFSITTAGNLRLVTTGGGLSNQVVSSGTVPTGAWAYVMASLDHSATHLYCNNQLIGSKTGMPLPDYVPRQNCYIGTDGRTNHWNGLIDEIRVWSTVLDEDERDAAMYDITSRLNQTDLTAHFSFDPYKGNLILEHVSGFRGLVMDATLVEPGAPASGTRLYADAEQAYLYIQNEENMPGYNPNEEHAILHRDDRYDVAYAFRDDLNTNFNQSAPFVLVNHLDPETGRPAMDALRVVRTTEVFQVFKAKTLAGQPLEGPHPLDLVPDHWTGRDILASGLARRARDNTWFALAGGSTPTGTGTVVMRNYYPMQAGFWFPGLTGDQPALGTPVPWLPDLSAEGYKNHGYPTSGLPQSVTWTIAWPPAVPNLRVGDTLIEARDGLPDIWNQLSVDVWYEQATNSVVLFDPVCPRGATLEQSLEEFGFETGGAAPTIYLRNGRYYFHNLPPDLSERFYFDPSLASSNLVLIGQYRQTLTGSGYLLVNVLDEHQRAILQALVPTGNAHYDAWSKAIDELAPHKIEVFPDQPFSGIALHAHGEGAGYVTLAFNNATNPALGVGSGTPISLSLIHIATNLATGRVIPMKDPYNLLSEQMNMLFNLDFAGEPGSYEFEWRWSEPNPDGTTPSDPLACAIYRSGAGINKLHLDGTAPDDLLNRFFAVRYRPQSAEVEAVAGTNWSPFTEFSLSEGWVQRILNSMTPFEQRMRDLYNYPVETQISMISQAGPPYEGDVALNQDNIENVGLIELYQTVLNRARMILDSTGMTNVNASQQLLLAASRLNDLYMLLGNEAYADAQDPTIGFGSTMTLNNIAVLPVDYGSLASSLFCFDNQVPSLLDEELALLRGRGNPELAPGMDVSPVYNRLFWNYTRGITAGEVAYAVNYDITGHTNAVIDATSAKQYFPQGHGDAWGHYLDALTVYYKLLRHDLFDWGAPSISPLLMNDLTIDADYYDEKKFAEAAAALARTGVDIIEDTYRKVYDESHAGLFTGYTDVNTNRAWGVGQWGSRVGLGALYNWAVGNSLLPAPPGMTINNPALHLGTNGYVSLPARAYFPSGSMTVEFWVKVDTTPPTGDVSLMEFREGTGESYVSIDLIGPDYRPRFIIEYTGISGGAAILVPAISDTSVIPGEWTHIAAVDANGIMRLYVNGVFAGQADMTGIMPMPTVHDNATIGSPSARSYSLSARTKLLGSVSDVRIWNRSRTAAEIAGMMHQRLSGNEDNLVAYWPLNEGSGTLLNELVAIGPAAQATGETDWTTDGPLPAMVAGEQYDDPGILRIDRSTVSALGEMSASVRSAQAAVDKADRGLNPLGLDRSAIPFDIDPLDIDGGGSHFEQILDRAEIALNNAHGIFDAVQEAKQRLRQQNQSANNFQAAAISQETDYRNSLIEIYGYPYSDDIGAGKTYPAGYDGPDLYHYMYVDMSALGWSGTEIEPIHAVTYRFTGDGADSVLDPFGFATNEPPGVIASNVTNSISFYYAEIGLPCKPTLWTGTRRAEGRLQMAYGEFLRQLLSYRLALETYEQKTEYLNEMVDWYVETYAPYKEWDYANSVTLQTMKEARNTYEAAMDLKKLIHRWRMNNKKAANEVQLEIVSDAVVGGMAFGGDIFAGIKSAILAAGKAQQSITELKEMAMEVISLGAKYAVETAEYGIELTKLTHEYKLENINQETELGELARAQARELAAVKVALQGLVQSCQNMLAVEQEGQRLLANRQRDRLETANRIAAMRYSDMAFRIFRDEAIGRYRSSFDLAAMYTFLAAKAYDYETGLLPAESANDPGARFLGDVVRARTLGMVSHGEPQTGGVAGEPGLADILARMKANWTVLDGRLGFNNPDWRKTSFSLRTELFRILPGPEGDEKWRTTLNACMVANLFEMPEFRRYCIPFAAEGGLMATEPAIVIPFSTTIDFGHNFFGRYLAGGDHAFSSTEFATKIRSVGVWFSNYTANVAFPVGLANTPEAYLIPVGIDTMRSPSDITGSTLRRWQVMDQAIPVPYVIGDADVNDANWIPLYDSLPGPLAAIRRYNALTAYDDAGLWNSTRVNYSSRLIGRSVWNSRWYLIIPAGSLNALRTAALDMFINGKNGDGNGVKDIKLLLETYSYSGN